MSVRMAYCSPSFTNHIATPATGAFKGTPASMSESDAPQMVAMEDEPFRSDVGQDGVLLALLHQSHRDSGNGSFQGHARIHERERRAANGGHGGRTVRLENVGDDAHGVGPVIQTRKHVRNSALGECAVANLATAGATHKSNFTNRKRRKIIVQHEALLGLTFEAFETLHRSEEHTSELQSLRHLVCR